MLINFYYFYSVLFGYLLTHSIIYNSISDLCNAFSLCPFLSICISSDAIFYLNIFGYYGVSSCIMVFV